MNYWHQCQAERLDKSARLWLKIGTVISIPGLLCIALALMFGEPVYWSGYFSIQAMQYGILILIVGIPVLLFGFFQRMESRNYQNLPY